MNLNKFNCLGLILASTIMSSNLQADVSGTTFRDYNADGIKQGGEPGEAGIIVNAYANDNANKDVLVATTTSVAGGSYSLAVPLASYPVRLEFSIPVAANCSTLVSGKDFSSAGGAAYGTSVQFVNADGEIHDYAYSYPTDFSTDSNPPVYTAIQGHGDPLNPTGDPAKDIADIAAIIKFNLWDSDTASNSGRGVATGAPWVPLANQDLVGTIKGLAYSRHSDKIFAAAMLKRHSGLGPLGGGGVYLIDPTKTPATQVAADVNFLDLDAIGIATSDEVGPYVNTVTNFNDAGLAGISDVIGTNVERGLFGDKTQPSFDPAAFGQTGRLSLGDIDISEDGQYLYVVNLYDRTLYRIDLTDPANPVAPTLGNVATKVTSYPIPDKCNYSAAAGEYRPFGLGIYRGSPYLGVTCSGQAANGDTVGTTADMKGFVIKLDEATNTWSDVTEWTFDYRDLQTDVITGFTVKWHPWSRSGGNDWLYGTPLITDIGFDNKGNILVGIGDRWGDQVGYPDQRLDSGNRTDLTFHAQTQGDILSVPLDTNTCNYVSNPNDFYNDTVKHDESSSGMLGGHHDADYDIALSTFMDPINNSSSGIVRFDNATGFRVYKDGGGVVQSVNNAGAIAIGVDGYEIVQASLNYTGKSNGLGDLETMEIIPPIEIGNLVWDDADADGIQDADENGIPGVSVQLLDNLNAVIATTATDAKGYFIFNHLNVGGGSGLKANTDYSIRINPTQFTASSGVPGTPLSLKALTTKDVVANGLTNFSDNDADVNANGEAVITLTTGLAGQNNHTFDFGFVSSVSIGSTVWDDTNNNGLQETGELGIPLATVRLLNVGGPNDGNQVVGVNDVVTGADGSYYFDGLTEGDYKVRVTMPANYTKSTAQTIADNNDTANDSNIASTAGNVHTSGMFTLTVGGEPTAIQESGGLVIAGNNTDDADNAAEDNGNMTVDFGFYRNDISTPVSIGSAIWNDTNNNGVQDSNEVGITGAVVTLLDSGGVPVIGYAPITTGINGLYYFGNLPEGDYQVQVVVPAGFIPSAVQEANANTDADNDSNIDTASSVGNIHKSGTVTLSNNGEPDAGANGVEAGVLGGDDQDSVDDNNGNMTVDFGFIQLEPNAVSIGSLVWFDDNDNGKQDDGEQPLAGATVKLLDGLGVRVPGITEQLTGSNGLYFFDNLPPGNYQIEVMPPAGYEPSAIQNGTGNSDVADDSNIAGAGGTVGTYVSATFNLATGGEPTEAGGLAGSDDADNAAETSGNMTVDFGFNQPTANAVSIGSFIWSDTNMDGIQDGEPVISGATVTLLNSNGTPVVGVNPQTTGNDGLYYFGNLPEGNYRVSVSIPAAQNLAPTFVQEANADGNADNDSNIASSSDTVDGSGNVTDTVYTSGIVALVAGDEPLEGGALAGDTQDANDANGNMTVDFGFVPQGLLGGLSGNVSEDTNNDGLVDNVTNPNDPNNVDKPIAGVTLQLYTAAGQPVLDSITGQPVTTVTDADGNYLFDNLIPGPYQVRELQPGGFASVSDIDPSDPLNDIIGDGTPINVLASAIAPGNNFIERFDPTAVPTMSEWALILLMMMLGLVGIRQTSTRGGIRF